MGPWMLVLLLFVSNGSLLRGEETAEPPDYQPSPREAPTPPGKPKLEFPVKFLGVDPGETGVLRENLAEQLGGIRDYGLNPARANDTAFFLSLYFLRQGYAHVRVQERIEGNTLILDVTKGSLVTLGEIVFKGNESIDREKLLSYLIGPTRERFSRFRREDALPFIAEDIKTGASRIKGLYLSEGFVDVEVSKPEIGLSDDGTVASVTLSIVEGTRYTVGQPVVTGHISSLSDEEEKAIETAAFGENVGKPYTPQRIVNMRRALVYEYKKKGYFKAAVQQSAVLADAREGVVPVQMAVDAGALYTFDGTEFRVEEDARLKRSFLENRFRGLQGRVYNPEELDELFRELMRTGLFSQLRIRPEAIEGNQVKLDVLVEEARAKDVGFSLGYSTFEGPFVGATLTERNLFGTGRPLTFNGEISSITYRGEILYVDRWFLETKNQLRLRLGAETTDYDSYSKFQVGALAELSRKLTKNWKVAAFVLPQKVEIANSTIDPEFLGPTSYFVSSAGISSTFDFRDSILNPHNGWVFNTTFDVASSALGSQVQFFRATYRFSYYRTFGPVLFAVGARGGVISPSGGEMLPIDENFFTGGSRTVRSFADRKLGPKDSNGDPIGGQVLAVYNVEVVFPLFGGLEGALFVDAGSIGRTVSDGFGETRFGIGGGLRYALPIGPLRLDYGVNPDPQAYEAGGAFHFSFGFAF